MSDSQLFSSLRSLLQPYRTALIALVCLLWIAGLTTFVVYAQDDVATPTDAPSKTPTPLAAPTLEATVEAAEATSEDRGIRMTSLTQGDLRILTGNVQRPNGMAWFEGQIYASCTGDWTIYQLDDETGQTVTYIYGIRNAHTMFPERGTDNELNLWVPDFQANSLSRITRMGVTPITSNLNGPWGIAYFDAASFLISNIQSNNVTRVGRDGTITPVIEGLAAPTGIVRDTRNVYVANNGSTRRAIEWYRVADLATAQPAPTPAPDANHSLVSGLQNVTGLAIGPDNFLYFAYSLGTRGVVGRVDPVACEANGGCTQDQVEIVVLTELAAPLAGLTVSPEMRIYVHTMFSPDIYWGQLPQVEAEATVTPAAG